MSKILWLDTETTGLDPLRHGLIEIGGIVEIDFEIKEEFDIKIGIMEGQEVDEGAALIQGLTLEQFKQQVESFRSQPGDGEIYQNPLQAYRQLKWIFDQYVDRYDKADKFIVAGYNIGFDISFLEMFFKRMGDNYLYSYITSPVDILAVVRFMSLGMLNVENHKLETICKAMNIPLEAHNALNDIRATREIAYRIMREMNENAFETIENLEDKGNRE